MLTLLLLAGCSPYGLAERPINATCAAPPRPPAASDVALERAFPALSFAMPLDARQPPGDGSRWYVAEKTGKIWTFANDEAVTAATLFADTSGIILQDGNETGLLGFAFDPEFATNGYVWLSFTADRGGLTSVVARFHSADGGATLDLGSEHDVFSLAQPFENHNGGNVVFGPDGDLYLGYGDGGSQGDPNRNGQDTSVLLGKILRLDVHGGDPYAIPADNPFADGGGRGEIFAYGFRNPWRFSFDRGTGALWVGDVGQDHWEEVDRVDNGGNYGWSDKEGTHCYNANPCDLPGLIDPVVEYSHQEGQSIAGGYVYRGTAIPDLIGQFVFTDTYTGAFWSVAEDESTGEPVRRLLAEGTGLQVAAFGESNDGELLAVDYGGGGLWRLVPGAPPAPSEFPAKLSETGCVDPNDPTTPAPGVLAYDVNVPLWSDGAGKGRFFAIPDGTRIGARDDGALEFPIGTVLMKDFSQGDQRVETRLLCRHEDGGWAGYSYAWNADGTDADLLLASEVRSFGDASWSYPSRGQCLTCHNEAAGRVLGARPEQLDRDHDYDGRERNQLDTLVHVGLLAPDVTDPSPMPTVDDEAMPVEDRARAYLAANCAQCHRPGGGLGGGDLDLRWGTPLADSGLCDAPHNGDLGVADALVVAPGDPARSILSLRLRALDTARMPPLASSVVDADGTALVDAWIGSLASCP